MYGGECCIHAGCSCGVVYDSVTFVTMERTCAPEPPNEETGFPREGSCGTMKLVLCCVKSSRRGTRAVAKAVAVDMQVFLPTWSSPWEAVLMV